MFSECPSDENVLCSEVVICTESITLSIKPQKAYLLYDEIADYNRNYYKKVIVPEDAKVKSVRSRRRKRTLLSLEFRYGDTRIALTAKREWNCMVASETKVSEQEKNRDWRYAVVGNIWNVMLTMGEQYALAESEYISESLYKMAGVIAQCCGISFVLWRVCTLLIDRYASWVRRIKSQECKTEIQWYCLLRSK